MKSYAKRFVDYGNVWHKQVSDRPPMMGTPQQGGKSGDSSAQSSVLARKTRYNDKKTTQSVV